MFQQQQITTSTRQINMTYFYYSPKQADYYGRENQQGGRFNFSDNSRSFWKVNYVLDGDRMIPFTEQGSCPPERKNQENNWGRLQISFCRAKP